MSERYAQLLATWRNAADAARAQQDRIKEHWSRHLEGTGPAPTADEIEMLHHLREPEAAALNAALEYVQRTGIRH